MHPVKWSSSIKKVSDNTFDLTFRADIQKDWYVYSHFLENADGPVPTTLYLDDEKSVKPVDKIVEKSGKKVEEFDKNFDMELIKLKEYATFTQRIKVDDVSKPVTGALEFMTCTSDRCLPPTEVPFKADLAAVTMIVGDDALTEGGSQSTDAPTIAGADPVLPTFAGITKKNIGKCVVEKTQGKIHVGYFYTWFSGRTYCLAYTVCISNDTAYRQFFYQRK